jgi:Protein of unknown function (DUF982)
VENRNFHLKNNKSDLKVDCAAAHGFTRTIYHSSWNQLPDPALQGAEKNMMIDKRFEKPLGLVLAGSHHMINSIREASWLLADQWPNFSSESFQKALAACADALEGKRSTSYARRALVVAAHRDKVEIIV